MDLGIQSIDYGRLPRPEKMRFHKKACTEWDTIDLKPKKDLLVTKFADPLSNEHAASAFMHDKKTVHTITNAPIFLKKGKGLITNIYLTKLCTLPYAFTASLISAPLNAGRERR